MKQFSVRSLLILLFVLSFLGFSNAISANAALNDYFVTDGVRSFKPYDNQLFTPNNFAFWGFSEGSGSYQIISRPASSGAQLTAKDYNTNENIVTSPCPDYGLDSNSYKSACFTVYATNNRVIEFNYSDPLYSGGEAVLTQNYYPDSPENIPDLVWLKSAYLSNWAPTYASAFYGFQASNDQVNQDTADRIQGLQALDAMVGVGMAGVHADQVILSTYTDPDTGVNIVKYGVKWSRDVAVNSDNIVSSLNVAQKGAAAAYGQYSESNDMWLNNLSYIVDAGAAASSLADGDMYSAWQTIVMDFSQAAVYGYGVYKVWEIDKAVNAHLIVNEIIEEQVFHGGIQRELIDSELVTKIEQIAIDSDETCGAWDDWFGACGWDRYDEGYVLAMYHDTWTHLQEWITTRKLMPNLYVDVDLDGILNVDEVLSGYNPNNPNDPPPPPPSPEENKSPVAVFSANSYQVAINSVVTLDASSSYDSDGNVERYEWYLMRPDGTSALSEQAATTISYTLNQEGDYTVRLRVFDGIDWSLFTYKTISVTAVHPNVEIDYEDDQNHIYITNLTLGTCQLRQIGSFTVPTGEKWLNSKFAASQGDLILLVRRNSPPDLKNGNTCSSELAQAFDADGEYDWYRGTEIYDYTTDMAAGTTLYLAAFSYDGVSNFSINSIVKVTTDLDGDGVPDNEEDLPCRGDINETFDDDGDGTCNNGDAFPNDPAASIDTDSDGYPDSWNSEKTENDSTTGLVLDHPLFVNDSSEWADTDGDTIGDNADKFPEDSAASVDTDGDGYPDFWNSEKTENDSTTGLRIDDFPVDIAAAVDTDGDGYPNYWNTGKTESDSTTGLILDDFPTDVNEWLDSDGDEVGDNSDWAPNDYTEWVDSDGDGVGDNSDVAPNDPSRSTNMPPTLDPFVDQYLDTGEIATIPLTMQDADNDQLAVNLISAPSFVTFSDNTIQISPVIGDGGYFEITVRVSDNFGGVAAQRFSVTVTQSCVSSTYYVDNDLDGFGSPATFVQECTQPQGYVANNLDCNDSVSSINPDAIEVCDQLDDDCNDLIDENDVCVQVTEPFPWTMFLPAINGGK